MIKLDFEKTEELIFRNESLRKKLPEFSHLFNQYNLSIRVPALRPLGKRSILEFLEKVNENQLELISLHLGYKISKDNLDFQIVRNLNFTIENICESLCESNTLQNMCISRDNEEIKITFWR